MDGKEETLGTDGNSFLGLHSHHVSNGEPPDKAVTFLLANNTTRINLYENSTLLSFNLMLNSERMVLLHLKHKILCS